MQMKKDILHSLYELNPTRRNVSLKKRPNDFKIFASQLRLIFITLLFSAEVGDVASLPPVPIYDLLSLKPVCALNTEQSKDWLITFVNDLSKRTFMWAQTHWNWQKVAKLPDVIPEQYGVCVIMWMCECTLEFSSQIYRSYCLLLKVFG